MNIKAKQQYMETLRERYLKSNKKGKGEILDEYCRNTNEDRKYAIKKFRYKIKIKEYRKKRKEYYDGYVKSVLVLMWRIFDYPCGQRLETSLKDETDRMRKMGEIICSDEVAEKLKKITSATIDRKLEHEREVELNKRKYKPTHTFPLKKEVPVKTSADLDRENPGRQPRLILWNTAELPFPVSMLIPSQLRTYSLDGGRETQLWVKAKRELF